MEKKGTDVKKAEVARKDEGEKIDRAWDLVSDLNPY